MIAPMLSVPIIQTDAAETVLNLKHTKEKKLAWVSASSFEDGFLSGEFSVAQRRYSYTNAKSNAPPAVLADALAFLGNVIAHCPLQ